MARKKSAEKGSAFAEHSYELPPSELIVMAKKGAELRSHQTTVSSLSGADVKDLSAILSKEGITMAPLFGDSEEQLQQEMSSMAAAATLDEAMMAELPDLSLYYKVEAPEDKLEALAAKLCGCGAVEAAYVKPPATPSETRAESMAEEAPEFINMMSSIAEEAEPATINFTARQAYLGPAPAGIDAYYAATLSGGRGAGVGICDIEGAWRFTHEDLRVNQGGVVGGTPSSDMGWRNHGTAVIGVLSGDRNSFGITGIAPDARIRGISIFGGMGTAGAIRRAAQVSRKGDIILLELHRPGPRFNFQGRSDQKGYIAIEWWPDDFAAVRYAVTMGMIVVGAAGNGAENLNASIYNTRPAGFPNSWRNPFNRSAADSGAILVGAGAPPPGTHGRNHGPDRSRLDFSNYGSAVDAQGWGREVTTTGYGDLQGGSNEDLWYTDRFSGTSSASPIVVGALACVQGVLKARRRPVLSPARARSLLRSTGSAQTSATGRPSTQRIGRRPNLRQLVQSALYENKWIGVQFTGPVAANATQRWFTHSWPEHWHVVWNVVPLTPRSGGPQIDFDVQVERASDQHITYWITVKNLTNQAVNIEARYAILGW
ncbi:MAG: S8 family peptidase [Gammaproteobacteria bacterium]|nr:S8 family peptidase [Gammaproteobacteria bacterium]